jgi:prepilin-type N-terminal cleavage/methylation domain-containing protein
MNMKVPGRAEPDDQHPGPGAFTLIELLVVSFLLPLQGLDSFYD